MATSTTFDVELENDSKMDSLDFQDIPHDKADVETGAATHEFTNFPHTAVDSDEDDADDDKEQLLKEGQKSASFWTFAYYQQFFDVDTHQVGKRILGSMVPNPRRNYLVKQIRPTPDLYGPFWICTTLVFTTAIAGNLANYFSAAGKDYHWQYDFHKVTIAATVIFSYWWLVPLALFGALWWRSSSAKYTFLEIICVYGYSMAIFVPISILWVIQVPWLQWLLVIVGATLSGTVLLLTFWPLVSEDNKKVAVGLMIFIFVMHAALAAGFVLYFFHAPAPAKSMTPATIANSTVAPSLHKGPPARTKSDETKSVVDGHKSILLPSLVGKGEDQAQKTRDVKKSATVKEGLHETGSSDKAAVHAAKSEKSLPMENKDVGANGVEGTTKKKAGSQPIEKRSLEPHEVAEILGGS